MKREVGSHHFVARRIECSCGQMVLASRYEKHLLEAARQIPPIIARLSKPSEGSET